VLNRFLRETNGFQFEVAWWAGKWLGVPSIVACTSLEADVRLLSLVNGAEVELSKNDFVEYIENIDDPDHTIVDQLHGNELALPDLVESLVERYPGMRRYPYFDMGRRSKWMDDYHLRTEEVAVRKRRERIPPQTPPILPIKGETTGQRPADYMDLRDTAAGEYFTIDWVEWQH
jgi:hypothetical protein